MQQLSRTESMQGRAGASSNRANKISTDDQKQLKAIKINHLLQQGVDVLPRRCVVGAVHCPDEVHPLLRLQDAHVGLGGSDQRPHPGGGGQEADGGHSPGSLGEGAGIDQHGDAN